MKPDVYQIETIGHGSLSVMAKPVAGEWIDDEFSGIAALGINRIVSLLEYHEAVEVGLGEERQITEKHNMEYISYPIQDRGLPASVSDYLEFTRSIFSDVAKGFNTVIHCRAGIGRTGLVAAGVLLHCGYKPEEAFQHISHKRGVVVPDTQEQINCVMKCHAAMPGR